VLSLENDTVRITTSIRDTDHIVACDLCGNECNLGPRASIGILIRHRNSEKCKIRQRVAGDARARQDATGSLPVPAFESLRVSSSSSTPHQSPATPTSNDFSFDTAMVSQSASSVPSTPKRRTVAFPASPAAISRTTSVPALPNQPMLHPILPPPVPCPGFEVEVADTVWNGYAFGAHIHDHKYSWEPKILNPERNTITMRSVNCSGYGTVRERKCKSCLTVSNSPELREFLSRALLDEPSKYMHAKYYTPRQQLSLIKDLRNQLRDAHAKVRKSCLSK
jgi:hypothetical protein